MKSLKVGLISFAHGHAYSYLNSFLALPEVEIAGIADEVISRVETVGSTHGIPLYDDYRELLKTDIDAVAICSENVKHAEHVIAAAEAGKHVICEKPLGLSVEEMERMIEACQANGVQLMTAFPCRYLAAVVNAKNAVDAGEIGDIVAIKGTNRGSMPGQWFVEPHLSGGGALLDHTVHVMDLMNWFTGSKVTEVYAYAATLFHEELKVDDAGMIHVRFASGVFGGLIVLILMLYFVSSLGSIKRALYQLVPASQREKFIDISEQISTSVGRSVIGQGALGACNGILTFLVLTVLGWILGDPIEYTALFAFVAFLFSLVPLVGTVTGSIIITLGVWAFAAYWLIKTLEMRESDADQRGLDGALERKPVDPILPGAVEGSSASKADRAIRRVMVPNDSTVERIVPADSPAPAKR